MMKVLLIGVVTREMAQSAVAAGYEVISLDYFGDSDQPGTAEVYSLVRDFSAQLNLKNLAEAGRTLAGKADKIVVGAGLESEPGLLKIGKPRSYWTNSAKTIDSVRDLRHLSGLLSQTVIKFPKTTLPDDQIPVLGSWLVKNSLHSGGLGVRDWDGQTVLQTKEVLQEKIEGQLMSACFLANGTQAKLLGLSRQYEGVPELGAPPYVWCGNIAPYVDPALENAITKVVQFLTKQTGLVGVNGIDFVVRDGEPYLLEINPRWTGSLELFECLFGLNMFQMHVEACQGKLPESLPSLSSHKQLGKGIFYTRHNRIVGNTSGWKKRGIADIPHSGETIPAGAPVCTIFSEGRNAIDCWDNLQEKAEEIQNELHGEKSTIEED